jgi:hypothetical protein
MSDSDFNGDGRDDILWRNDNGTVGYWYGEENGGFTINPKLTNVSNDWTIVGTADFNGDGRDDILWANAAAGVGYWYGEQDGSFSVNSKILGFPAGWYVTGTGDFNGDGNADILWRQGFDGRVGTWLGQDDGSFQIGIEVAVPRAWGIVGTGDFDEDGHDDILWWGNNYLGTWSGTDSGFTINDELTYMRVSTSGTGDFDGDGRDDVVLVDDWSFYSVLYALPEGGFGGEYDPFGDASSATRLRRLGDFDGDGRADTLFRHTNGTITVDGLSVPVPNDWHIVGDFVDRWYL